MNPHSLLVLAVASVAAASAAPPLPRGNGDFHLGMFRTEVDSSIALRRAPVLSAGSSFLVCGSEEPGIEYEQYSFFQAPHGIMLLWRVTIGYRLGASRDDLEGALGRLRIRLGEPSSDTGGVTGSTDAAGEPIPIAARQVIWVDPFTAVQLGARWGDGPPLQADRMMVTWTDRRLQRLVDARRRNGKSEPAE